MRIKAIWRISLAVALTIGASVAIDRLSPPAQAVQLADGRVYFVRPPSLVRATTTTRTASASSATYYFTIQVPENSGEPLQRVTVVEQNGDVSARAILFNAEDTEAFVGLPRDRGAEVPLGAVNFDPDTQTIAVNFNPPVAPGTTVTIGLKPERNPQTGGVYLFGVTAFPQGQNPYGQFLGYGRIDFNDPGDGRFF
jgi:hypothetical protein